MLRPPRGHRLPTLALVQKAAGSACQLERPTSESGLPNAVGHYRFLPLIRSATPPSPKIGIALFPGQTLSQTTLPLPFVAKE